MDSRNEKELREKASKFWNPNPEDQYQLALHLWKKLQTTTAANNPKDEKEKKYLTTNQLKKLKEITSWFKKASDKKHFEATRHYVLFLIGKAYIKFVLKNKRLPLSLKDMQAMLNADKKTVKIIKDLLNKPAFAQDDYAQFA